MTPIEFPEMTGTAAKNQLPYLPLPMHRNEEFVISCWKMTRRERFRVLFTGKVWLWLKMWDSPITPSSLDVDSPFIKE